MKGDEAWAPDTRKGRRGARFPVAVGPAGAKCSEFPPGPKPSPRIPTVLDSPIRRGADEMAGGNDFASVRRCERLANFYDEALQT